MRSISQRWFGRTALLACALTGSLWASVAHAVPSFTRQTGADCAACHIGGSGPNLTAYGIKFKLGAYADTDGKGVKVPLSARLRAAYSNPALGESTTRFDQAGVQIAGRFADGLGALARIDHDNTATTDVTLLRGADLKYARETKVGGMDTVAGVSINNGPGVQDPLGTLPGSGFPVISNEGRAFGQEWAHSMLGGRLAHRSLGVTGFVMLDNNWYAEVGNYNTLSRKSADNLLGHSPTNYPGKMDGFNPYLRAFYMKDLKSQFFTVGVVGMGGKIETTPGVAADKLRDFGVDASYAYLGNREHIFKIKGMYLKERRNYGSTPTNAFGQTALPKGSVDEATLMATYVFRNTYGLMFVRSHASGSTDSVRYFPNGNPGSDFQLVSLFYTPFGKEDSWGAPWANLRISLNRATFSKFNGASTDLFGNRFVPSIPLFNAKDLASTSLTAEIFF